MFRLCELPGTREREREEEEGEEEEEEMDNKMYFVPLRCTNVWLVGWLVDRLVGDMAGWLRVSWLVGWLFALLLDWLAGAAAFISTPFFVSQV